MEYIKNLLANIEPIIIAISVITTALYGIFSKINKKKRRCVKDFISSSSNYFLYEGLPFTFFLLLCILSISYFNVLCPLIIILSLNVIVIVVYIILIYRLKKSEEGRLTLDIFALIIQILTMLMYLSIISNIYSIIAIYKLSLDFVFVSTITILSIIVISNYIHTRENFAKVMNRYVFKLKYKIKLTSNYLEWIKEKDITDIVFKDGKAIIEYEYRGEDKVLMSDHIIINEGEITALSVNQIKLF